jgi:hypothetical protein
MAWHSLLLHSTAQMMIMLYGMAQLMIILHSMAQLMTILYGITQLMIMLHGISQLIITAYILIKFYHTVIEQNLRYCYHTPLDPVLREVNPNGNPRISQN